MKIGIGKTSKNQEAAWKFLKWLTYEPEATRFRAEVGIGMPAINDEQAINSFLNGESAPESLPAVYEVLTSPENTMTMLDVPGLSEANNILTPASDEVMNGLSQATDVIPPAVQQANEVLAEEWQKANASAQ
jgi:multiple sugar transport system substrate-binding protein